jgi:hypothetical protein
MNIYMKSIIFTEHFTKIFRLAELDAELSCPVEKFDRICGNFTYLRERTIPDTESWPQLTFN